MGIEKVDKNLVVSNVVNEKNIAYYDVKNAPFAVYGLQKEEVFKRMPADVAKATSEGVTFLHTNTAGGRVRFKTNSEYIAISVKKKVLHLMAHMPLSGSSGFDMYTYQNGEYTYVHSYMPSALNGGEAVYKNGGYDAVHHFETREMRDIVINFPLYDDVDQLYIGIEDNAVLEEGDKYKYDKPIYCYGSSITQGGCASRPGNAYSNILSRMLDADVWNLGFSGSAKGEDAMADYIASLDMKLFIYDYDHNAPNDVRLKETHEKMFKKIREKNPDLPIVIVSRPQWDYSEQRELRREVIKTTYKNALDSGDKNVYFVNGSEFFEGYGNDATVDGCHPNDLGFMCMAKKLYEVISQIL